MLSNVNWSYSPCLLAFFHVTHFKQKLHLYPICNLFKQRGVKLLYRAQKEISAISAWENTKKSAVEAKLKKLEEQLEKKKAEYGEKMKNKVAQIHKEAEEKRAMVEAKRGEEFLKAEEMAAKYRATGQVPKKLFGCF
ncbi:unnamed protein product [Linum tenue]|uniref:Remorin C-terminal domain-containing protein n=1 Tax=Linum tenue TaxID=586396 RepID=A0AAV0PNM1_9ROSI|nr:unnamed protein product [Linum tenue]